MLKLYLLAMSIVNITFYGAQGGKKPILSPQTKKTADLVYKCAQYGTEEYSLRRRCAELGISPRNSTMPQEDLKEHAEKNHDEVLRDMLLPTQE